jgi:hypothetical protein
MLCYRDMQFCSAPCLNTACRRQLTDEVRKAAAEWWGEPEAPIAFGDMHEGCPDYIKPEGAP